MLDPKVYYQNLSKKDKGKFLRYLSQRYDYASTTMSGKLRENSVSELRRDETENIIKAIEEGVWRI
jgi:hypothetical protein